MAELRLTEDMLPEIEEWEQGQTYQVNLKVKQNSVTDEGAATFEVVEAKGKPAEMREMPEEELPTFEGAVSQAAQEQERTDLLEPGYGGSQ